ncbi:hypothetical protein COMNV_00344 [Commensalibacter sp. Nvir]|uniref:hypothetical protein n=1 Tax=Commensalibacter sp. Nvir TaxID=3069817 RepID=UPI002D62D89C|nr:hypothetical protein COMNV_00344 [Commensalibacter sp. Nvir]
MIKHLKKIIFGVLSAFALVFFHPHSAKAQHIVTEAEAGRLTLASLTAPPVVRHHVRSNIRTYRSNYAVRTVSYRIGRRRQTQKLFRIASYRTIRGSKMPIKTAVYRINSRRKILKHRRRS